MKLHKYQERFVEFAREHKKCIMSVGMGLGKTAATIHFLHEEFEAGRIHSAIIVAPKRVALTVWKQEVLKWGLDSFYTQFNIFDGSKKKQDKILNDYQSGLVPFLVVGRDRLKSVANFKTDVLVIDELTSFKNVLSARSEYLNTIDTKRVIGLTGTFMANGAVDVFGQAVACRLYLAEVKRRGKYVFCSEFEAWRARYFYDQLASAKLKFHKWKLRVPMDDLIADIKDNIFTLDSKDYLDIPDVTYNIERIALSSEERKAYTSMNAMLMADVGGTIVSVKDDAKFMKLQTLCNGFVYDSTGAIVEGNKLSKLNAVVDFVTSAVGENERVLLFYSFKAEAMMLARALTANGVRVCSVSDKNFVSKWENGDIDVLFAHPASAGHGLNLQYGGRVICWSSIPYSYEFWAQANARLARQGQTQKVIIKVFTAEKTIEDLKYKALMEKTAENQKFIEITK